jgi:hypothetical protein
MINWGLSPIFKGDEMSRPQPLFEFADSVEDRILRRIPIETLVLTLIACVTAFVLFNPINSLLVLLGGLFAILNFYWLKSAVTKSLAGNGKKSIRALLPLYILRILLILGIFFIIIIFFSKKIFAFVVGFSMIIPVFLFEATGALSKLKQWKS